ncbi:MAG: glutamyl-tRNA reductase [Candidatus Latescibacteria bacterium]|nr:glutamyl-tRNA reductase [Candidatus Latescibacterota bacterium]
MKRSKIDTICLIGISYKTASVEIRERFSFSVKTIPKVLAHIRSIDGVDECVVISTCNRTEIYTVINHDFENFQEKLYRYIFNTTGFDKAFLQNFYLLRGNRVIEHLFNVACGFDSMVIGETQIFRQVKDCYTLACSNGSTGILLNRLFHSAFRVGKLVRSKTTVSEGAVSASSAVVLLAKKVFGGLNGKKVLLIGAGKVGKLCAKHLTDSGIGKLYIINRTIERAHDLSAELPGMVIPFNNLSDIIGKVDMVITSVTTRTPLITKDFLQKHIGKRDGTPLTCIDLGVPRNIEPDVSKLEGIRLFNIDDIEDVTFENHDKRVREKGKAASIIEEKVGEYGSWFEEREVVPVLKVLRAKCEEIRRSELRKIDHKISTETCDIIELVTHRIVRKILHNPTVNMRMTKSGEMRSQLLESINRLFVSQVVD